jgi:hypothetical protein
MGPIWAISYSDMYSNDWLILLFPNILILVPRLLFTFAIVRHSEQKSSLNLLCVSGALLIIIDLYICLTMMTVNSIFGTPPGVLALFTAPDVDVRLFVPVPILLLVGVYQVRKNRKSLRSEHVNGGPDGI